MAIRKLGKKLGKKPGVFGHNATVHEGDDFFESGKVPEIFGIGGDDVIINGRYGQNHNYGAAELRGDSIRVAHLR